MNLYVSVISIRAHIAHNSLIAIAIWRRLMGFFRALVLKRTLSIKIILKIEIAAVLAYNVGCRPYITVFCRR